MRSTSEQSAAGLLCLEFLHYRLDSEGVLFTRQARDTRLNELVTVTFAHCYRQSQIEGSIVSQ
jgi:hypothetical protein